MERKQQHYVSSTTYNWHKERSKDNFTVQKGKRGRGRERHRDRDDKGAYTKTLTVHILDTVEATDTALKSLKYTNCVVE